MTVLFCFPIVIWKKLTEEDFIQNIGRWDCFWESLVSIARDAESSPPFVGLFSMTAHVGRVVICKVIFSTKSPPRSVTLKQATEGRLHSGSWDWKDRNFLQKPDILIEALLSVLFLVKRFSLFV